MVKEGVTPRVTDGLSEVLFHKVKFLQGKSEVCYANENTCGVVKGVELKKSELDVHSFCFKKHKLLDKHDTI